MGIISSTLAKANQALIKISHAVLCSEIQKI